MSMKAKKGVAKTKKTARAKKTARTVKTAKPAKTSMAKEKRFLSATKKIVDSNNAPWKQLKVGRPGTPPRTLALCVLFMRRFDLSYRQVTARLQENDGLLKILGLSGAPSKSTIGVANKRISGQYLKRIEKKIAEA